MITTNDKELKMILLSHRRWLNGEDSGDRADLSYMDLRNRDLSYVNLRFAILEYADLTNVNLSYAKLDGANLSKACLKNADLSYASLSDTIFKEVDLSNSKLSISAPFEAKLETAILDGVEYNKNIVAEIYKKDFISLQCPEKGSFIGYKKAFNDPDKSFGREVCVELLIPEDAKRLSGATRQCRSNKAKVLSITSLDGKTEYNWAYSGLNKNFIYRVGETIEVKDFDENRWNEHSTGIHFFITKNEAIKSLL